MRTLIAFLAVLLFVFAGCESKTEAPAKKEDPKKPAAEKPAGDEAPTTDEAPTGDEAPAAGAGLRIESLGLTIDLPADTMLSDVIGGGTGAMIMGGPVGAMTVQLATDNTPSTIEKAKEDADMYGPQNLNEETLEDGWVLTYTNEGGMGTNYWITAYRTIDEKGISCSSTVSTEDQQKAVVAACKSLKP